MSIAISVFLLLNGQSVDFGKFKPILIQGVVRVPLRLLAERMGATVKHESYRHQAILKYKDEIIIFPDNSDIAIVNGKKINIGATMIQTDNARYVPVRFLCEEMNATVSFDEPLRKVEVQAESSN